MEPTYALDYSTHQTAVVRFILSGADLNPAMITEVLGIQPDEAWCKGDSIPPTSSGLESRPTRPFGRWMINAGLSPYDEVETQLEQLLTKLEQLSGSLIEYCHTYNGEIKIGFSSGACTIGIHFPAALIARIVKLGVALDIDIYMMANESLHNV